MKYLTLSATLFITIVSFGQKVTYGDLIGKNFIDTSNGNGVHAVGLFIRDSSNFTTSAENDFRTFKYIFDEDQQLIFVTKGSRYSYKKKEMEDFEQEEIIKVVDINTLQRIVRTEFSKSKIILLHRTN